MAVARHSAGLSCRNLPPGEVSPSCEAEAAAPAPGPQGNQAGAGPGASAGRDDRALGIDQLRQGAPPGQVPVPPRPSRCSDGPLRGCEGLRVPPMPGAHATALACALLGPVGSDRYGCSGSGAHLQPCLRQSDCFLLVCSGATLHRRYRLSALGSGGCNEGRRPTLCIGRGVSQESPGSFSCLGVAAMPERTLCGVRV